jgi:hypothetical protein
MSIFSNKYLYVYFTDVSEKKGQTILQRQIGLLLRATAIGLLGVI